jgi:hypothetical protein
MANYSLDSSSDSMFTHRPSLVVAVGDTLTDLALKHFGDARFAKLIATINRGEITTGRDRDGYKGFAQIFPGQQLSLPTKQEAHVYQRNFFTTSSKNNFDHDFYSRPAMPSTSIPKQLSQVTNIPTGPMANQSLAPLPPKRTRPCLVIDASIPKLDQRDYLRRESLLESNESREKKTMTLISPNCRVLEFKSESSSPDTIIKTQILDAERWVTVSTQHYSC